MTTPTEIISDAVKSSHVAIAKAEVLATNGAVITTLPITGGTVTYDTTNLIRANCDITLVDVDQVFDAYTKPGAYEVRISRGVREVSNAYPYAYEGDTTAGITGTALGTITSSGGSLRYTSTGADHHIRTETFTLAPGFWRNKVRMRLGVKAAGDPVSTLQVFYVSGAGGEAESRSKSQTLTQDGVVRDYEFDFGDHTDWTNFEVTRLRVDPGNNTDATVEIDYIRIGEPSPLATDTYISLGIFTFSADDVTASDVTVTATGADRSRRISRAKFTSYYTVTAGTNYATAIQTLISSRLSGLTFSFTPTTTTTPLLLFRPQEDPWEKASDMAASIGMELFFDRDGICVLRPVVNPETAPIKATYTEGTTANLLDVRRNRSDEGAYSHIIIVGASANSTAPVLAHARDTNPASATYYLGPFGDIPYFVTSGYIITLAQAQAQADAELLKRSGLVETVSLDLLVDPTLALGDVVSVDSSRGRINSRYVIESMTMPLTPTESLTAVMRKRNA